MASTTPSNDPFAPALHPDVPIGPPGVGLGDLVHSLASPLARLVDRVAGTALEHCPGCAQRRAKWNQHRLSTLSTLMSLSAQRRITPSGSPLQKWFAAHPPVDHIAQEPRPWQPMEPRHERAIIMPWLSSGPKWELCHALRSIEALFADRACPIYLLCDRQPSWLRAGGRLRVMEMPGYACSNAEGLREAWEFGCQVASKVAWWNDDIYLLKPTGWEDLRVALTEGELEPAKDALRASGNSWRRSLGAAAEDLKLRGFSGILRFATHTPYLFEAAKAREIAATYHLPFSGAFETLYHNHHGTPHEPVGPHRTSSLPCPSRARYLNHGRRGPDPSTRMEISKRFGLPAPWELVGDDCGSVWYVIPSVRPGKEAMLALSRWRAMGYKVAVQRDVGDAGLDVDLCLIRPYRGYAEAVNHLARRVLTDDPSANWIVTGGDDLFPDQHSPAGKISRECLDYFGGTLGVMQPTGHRHLVDSGGRCSAERACVSPWMGREWCERAYQGHGPLCEKYFHFYVDEELQELSFSMGLLWQRSDLSQHHEWVARPPHLARANSRFSEARQIFRQRKSSGFPGSALLP